MGGGMMGTTGTMSAWVFVWILLALAIGAAGGFLVARSLSVRRSTEQAQIPPADSPAVREAKEALKMRYARGEIDREEYLQGKVELED